MAGRCENMRRTRCAWKEREEACRHGQGRACSTADRKVLVDGGQQESSPKSARRGYNSYGRSNGPASQPLPHLLRTQVWPTNEESGCRFLPLRRRLSLQTPSANTTPSARGWSKSVLVNFGRLDVLTVLHDDRACFQNIFFRGLSGHTYAIPRRDSESSTAQAGSTFSILQFCTHPASSSWCVFVSGQCVDRRHGAPPHDH